jgi:hypothetical protein
LLDVARSGDAGDRLIATSLVTKCGPDAEAQWRQALDEDRLRPYAKIALSQLAGAAPGEIASGLEPSPSDLAWLLVDAVIVAAMTSDDEELAGTIAETVPTGETEIFEQVWRLDHPDAREALTLIGKAHPDKRTAKAARKASFKVSPA